MADKKKIKIKNPFIKKPEKNLKKPSNVKKKKKVNKYTIINKIGEGSFGKVYVVLCNDSFTKYVMKQITLSGLSKKEVKRTYQEVKLLQKFDHPNIIKFKHFFESGTHPKNLNIITEYAEKGDLYKLTVSRKGKKFEEKMLIDWLTQTCLALKYIHSKHIIHRDIKPHNIFLTKKGFIKIGDFGISKTLNSTMQNAKTFVGTTYYLPPELINGEDYSFMADVWSLGVTFYHLMTFKLPFDGNSAPAVMKKIMTGKGYEKIKNYSNDLVNVVYKMMSVDPQKRPKPSDILNMDFIKKRIVEYLNENKFNNIMSMTMIKQYQDNVKNDNEEDEKESLNDNNNNNNEKEKDEDKNNSNNSKIKININKSKDCSNKDVKHINIRISLNDQNVEVKRNKSSSKISLGQILLKAKNSGPIVYDSHQQNIPQQENNNNINEPKIKIKKVIGKYLKETKETQQKEEKSDENNEQMKSNDLDKLFTSDEGTRDATEKKFQFESKFFKENIIFCCDKEKEFDLRSENEKNKLLETKKNNEIKKEIQDEYDLQRQMNLLDFHVNGEKSDNELEKENKLLNENNFSNSENDSDSY